MIHHHIPRNSLVNIHIQIMNQDNLESQENLSRNYYFLYHPGFFHPNYFFLHQDPVDIRMLRLFI